ncbi:MAG: LysE family translocator [Anaerolineae bacterium]
MNFGYYMLKAVVLGFSASAMPGASQAYMINQAARYGWKRATLASFAPLLADGPIVLFAVLVLAALPAWAMPVLEIVGACFIFYLVYRAIHGLYIKESESTPLKGAPTLLAAITINLLNPVIYLYWSTVSGPIFVQGWRVSPGWGLGFLACFYGIMILTSNGIILVVSGLKRINGRIRWGLQIVSTGLLATMGLVQLVIGISALL